MITLIYLHSENSLNSPSPILQQDVQQAEKEKGQALHVSSRPSVARAPRSYSCPNPSVSSIANSSFSFSCS